MTPIVYLLLVIQPLIYFIFGIIFIRCIMPSLDQLTAWFLTAIENKKSNIELKTTKVEKCMEEIANKDTHRSRQIGFVVEDPSEYDIPNEDDEEYTEEE